MIRMIRITISEYLEKMWIHIFVIAMFIGTMLAQAAMVREITVRSSMYHAVADQMDERSVFLEMPDETMLSEAEKHAEVIVNQKYFAWNQKPDSEKKCEQITIRACPEKIMNRIPLRLDSGKRLEQCKTDENVIAAYIYENPLGIKAGDTVSFWLDVGDGIHEVETEFYIAGVLSEGQKMYGFSTASSDMDYTDMFEDYSYQQYGEIMVLTTQGEMKKLKESVHCAYDSGIVKFDSGLTDEQAADERQKLAEYERKQDMGICFIEDVFPEADLFLENSKEHYRTELKKYIPMIAVILLISLICLIGILAVKTDMNLKTYTVFYLCGMKIKKVILCSTIEILFDLLCAFVLSASAAVVINRFALLGKVNLAMDAPTVLAVCVYGMIAMAGTAVVTRTILKNNTPVQILKSGM